MGDDGARQLSPLLPRRLVRRDRQGGYVLRLGASDREMLRQLAPQFSALLEEPDQPVLRRLFPPAYSDPAHAEQQEEYRRLMQEDLVARHREELELLASTADADHLSEERAAGVDPGPQQPAPGARHLPRCPGGRRGPATGERRGVALPLAHLSAG